MTQLDRIEQKLDRLMRMMNVETSGITNESAALLASGGVDALQQYMSAEADRKLQQLKGGKQ